MNYRLLPLFLILSANAFAQHSATLSWTLSVTPGVTSQNIYRAPCTGAVTANACTEGTFAKLNGLTATATTFSDTTVVGGNAYSYYVTAVCPASGACVGESAPSNHFAVAIPGSAPAPPSGLTITNVSKVVIPGGYTFAYATWSDTLPNQTFTWNDATGAVIGAGSKTYPNSVATWLGLTPHLPISITVCDTGGCVTKGAS